MPNPMPISRGVDVSVTPVTFATTLNNSTPISFARGSAMSFTTPGSASGTITWYASDDSDGEFTPVKLPDGSSAVTSSLAPKTTFVAPLELFAVAWVKGVSSAADLACKVTIKS